MTTLSDHARANAEQVLVLQAALSELNTVSTARCRCGHPYRLGNTRCACGLSTPAPRLTPPGWVNLCCGQRVCVCP